jgi:hypothetical protein
LRLANRKLQMCLAALLLSIGCAGCREATSARPEESASASAQYREELLSIAIDNLNRLEDFTSIETLQQIHQRVALAKPPEKGFDPLLATWPEPEMQRQVVDRLNHWIRAQAPPEWKADAMSEGLPKALADLPQLKDLSRMEFSRFDGYALQEAVWLRDIGRWARGDVLDDLERAKCLFDWTVRNVQLDADNPQRIPRFPWETVLFGRGTASERAWVFMLLLRQLDIDAAILAIEEGGGEKGEESGKKDAARPRSGGPAPGPGTSVRSEAPAGTLRPWCVGVLIEGNVYLFDPMMGLPIPAADGLKLDGAGQLAIQPATLAQAASDEKLLRRLDVNEGRPYRVKASQAARVTALLEASPSYLACRMGLLESRLSGPRKMVLTNSPTACAQRWQAAAHVARTRLWLRPFETLYRRSRLGWDDVRAWLVNMMQPFYWIYEERTVVRSEETGTRTEQERVIRAAALGKGRILHLKGRFVGEDGAIFFYQMARPSNQRLMYSSAPLENKLIHLRGKQDASYWTGLITYQRRNYSAAIDWFTKETLLAYPNGPWTNGARYNLARAYEASAQTERAVLQYGSDASSPGYHGDLLRAKWLQELRPAK